MSEHAQTLDKTDAAPSKAPVATIVAPVVAFGATFVARKALSSAYRAATGTDAPSNNDRSVPLGKVIAWAAISGATAAVIEVVAFRAAARFFGE
jgi:hypothetical protein